MKHTTVSLPADSRGDHDLEHDHEQQEEFMFTARHLIPRYAGPLEDDDLTPEQAHIRDAILASRPRTGLSGPFGPWLAVPALADPAQRLGQACRYGTSLSMCESELVILLTGAKHRSAAEFDIHVPEALRAGLSMAIIQAIPRDDDFSLQAVCERVLPLLAAATETTTETECADDSTGKSRLHSIALFTAELLDTCTVSDATYKASKLALGGQDSVLVEITTIVGYYALVCLTLNVFQIPSSTATTASVPSSTLTATATMSDTTAADKAGTRQGLTDGGCGPHHPQLYQHSELVTTTFSLDQTSSSPSKLDELVQEYHRDGYIVLNGAFATHVSALDTALSNLVTGGNAQFTAAVHQLVASNITPDFTSGQKIPWIQYEAGTHLSASTNGADVNQESSSLLLTPEVASSARKLMGFVGYEDAIDEVVHDTRLLSIVAQLLDCTSIDQVELFQDMALLKPAGGGREKPWHQDKAYFNVALDTKVVGCWMAVDDATLDNGCLRFERGGHVHGPRMHFSVRDYQICDDEHLGTAIGANANEHAQEQRPVVAIPLSPGGLVLFDGMIPHGTPTNTSPHCRRALQFHWIKKEVAMALKQTGSSVADRTLIFGGAPNGLSC